MITETQPYYNYHNYLQNQYGGDLYSIPIDLNFGCPHRGKDNSGGCTFCPESGARAQQTINSDTIDEQIFDAVDFAKKRYGAKRFMAYIQAFTGTFAEASKQRKIYEHILQILPFEALIIGTRPDCIDNNTLEFLVEMRSSYLYPPHLNPLPPGERKAKRSNYLMSPHLNPLPPGERKFKDKLDVKIELGVQTSNNKTLSRINRCHTWEQSEEAIQRLHSNNIPVIAHVILGLPGEDLSDFIETADKLAQLPLSGIKIHNLHVIKNTALADEYLKDPFPIMNEHEYLDALIEYIRRTPSDIPIIRIQTDTPEDELVAPKWTTSKGQLIDTLIQHMNWRLAYQGELTKNPPPSPYQQITPEEIKTDDGSITFWSDTFKEHYHTSVGAKSEAIHKYIEPSLLADELTQKNVRLLDVCFGLGYNTLYACKTAQTNKNAHQLDIVALEVDRRVVRNASTATKDPWCSDVIMNLFNNNRHREKNISIELQWGDARHTARLLAETQPFDIIFLDAFSTQRNSELWTVDFFKTLKTLITPNGRLLTYCSSLPVISGLIEAGFHVGRTKSVGRIRGGSIASLSAEAISSPVTKEILDEIKTSSRGIPYRDPTESATNRNILKAREEIVKSRKK